ncbi:hypothetical protein RSK20926_17887 [Roseobacter sp. SK209-2-6]|nr:hypothetical protein RSK20926_17887 [Roseobacter sp. SK209-2-6]
MTFSCTKRQLPLPAHPARSGSAAGRRGDFLDLLA